MSLPPEPDSVQEILEDMETQAKEEGHDIGEGFVMAKVLGSDFHRMECQHCHDVAYVWPDGSGKSPMNPGQCRSKAIVPDLS